MLAWTDLASTWLVAPVTFLLGVALARHGHGYWVKRLAWTVPGCMLSIEFVKHLFQRARPDVPHPLLELATYSFPSGHAASATVLYGFLATFFCATAATGPWRTLVWSIAVCVIVGVAFSRLYLGVHYLTDVMGGLIMGLAWLTLAPRLVKRKNVDGAFRTDSCS